MSTRDESLCDALALDRTLHRLAREVHERRGGSAPLRLIGVRSRGVPVAERLAALLAEAGGSSVPVGAIDITLYRDDFGLGQRWPVLRGTEIDFEVDGAEIVLVDDVLFTGRTIRAALNAICDLGRPDRVRLLTVVDRGHRELPIQPDHVGLVVPTSREDRVEVRIRPVDDADGVVIVRPTGRDPGRA